MIGFNRISFQFMKYCREKIYFLCLEKLMSIDIDPKETENFAASLSKLACQKHPKANFDHFQVDQSSLCY